jgi:tricorn protease
MDGGRVIVPEFGSWSAVTGQWVIEGSGVAPTIPVQNTPADEIAGRDPQLQRAVQEVLEAIEADPPALPERPRRGPDTTP